MNEIKPTFTLAYNGSTQYWTHGDHSGMITFPQDERGPIEIEWDGDCPKNWEDIEECVEREARWI
jgi:hypothetical protein